jgi:RNA polymerase sigma factor (sigma-70 family)
LVRIFNQSLTFTRVNSNGERLFGYRHDPKTLTSTSMREAVIIQEIRNGNKKELAEVYKTHRSEFVGWASSHYQCTKEEARDIYQSTIITFYDNIMRERLQQLNGSVKTYLFAIGKNKILELRRADKKYDSSIQLEEFDLEDKPDPEKIKRDHDLTVVQRCLEKLGEPCRTMLELYYYHETSLDELASTLHYKNGDTVKNLKSRCLTRLRELVANEMKKTNV